MAGIETLRHLPTVNGGYTLYTLALKNIQFTSLAKWHMQHKPYTNDFPKELINK